MTHIPRALVEKVDNMHEQMGNVNGQMEVLRENEEEMLEIKNAAMERQNASDGLSRLDVAEERLSVPKGMTIETSKAKNQREREKKKD